MEVCGVSEGLRWALPSAFASPIRSVAESDEAYELASVMAGHQLTKDQDDYLEALTSFIEQYENKAHPVPRKKHTHEIPRYLCEENGMSGAGLRRLLEADRTLAARILRGERNLVSHIQKTCKRFKLSADRFLICKSGATPLGQAGFWRSSIPRRLGR